MVLALAHVTAVLHGIHCSMWTIFIIKSIVICLYNSLLSDYAFIILCVYCNAILIKQFYTGILEVLHCILIESPESLNIIQKAHIRSIISLLYKHGRNHKVSICCFYKHTHAQIMYGVEYGI